MSNAEDDSGKTPGLATPRVNPAIDLKQLSLTAAEGFVLSRMDGRTTVDELARLVQLPGAELDAMLLRLLGQGVLVVDGPNELATHRALFETKLRQLEESERIRLAAIAGEPELSALCFDPVPKVIMAVLDSPRLSLAHARLIANHHRDPRGLDALAAKSELFRDPQVQRLLLRNPQASEALARRMLSAKRLLEIHKVGISREVTERARRSAQQVLRQRFATGTADERVELILHTEGRALAGLAGLPVDGKTAALLCARPYHSMLLIQNIARWAVAPPPLIAHLLKQPMVRRSPQLKAALERHPNAPTSFTGRPR